MELEPSIVASILSIRCYVPFLMSLDSIEYDATQYHNGKIV